MVARVITTRITELFADDEAHALRKYAYGFNGKVVQPESTDITIECIEMVPIDEEKRRQ